jgi:hypothetical protein
MDNRLIDGGEVVSPAALYPLKMLALVSDAGVSYLNE